MDSYLLASEVISRLEILACIEYTHVHGIKPDLDCICGMQSNAWLKCTNYSISIASRKSAYIYNYAWQMGLLFS